MEEPKRKTNRLTTFLTLFLICSLTSCLNQNKLPDWIEGRWSVNFSDYSVEEFWTKNGETFRGKTLWKGELKSWQEDLTLYVNETGDLVYRTEVGDKVTNFVCHDVSSDTLVFVNNSNEFPKRLHYSKPVGNKMEVWIDNIDNDPNRIDFHFQKIK